LGLPLGAAKRTTDPYRIPVVVHVIHNEGRENISNVQIESQISVLNEDFNTPDLQLAGKPSFEFYLAQRDPTGQCTDGITRQFSALTFHDFATQEGALKALVHWPPERYLNIWVVRDIRNSNAGTTRVLGYARFPGDQRSLDGIVMAHTAFGRTGTATPPYNLGKTCSHEVGHWLALYHTFEDGCAGTRPSDCATAGDRLCDTPPQADPQFSCPLLPRNTCTEAPIDRADLPDNLMDYLPDLCARSFTPNQAERMYQSLLRWRASIVSPNNLLLTGWGGCTPGALTGLTFEWHLGPNPLTEQSLLQFTSPIAGRYAWSLTDQLGRTVARESLELPSGLAHTALMPRALAPGAYLFRFDTPYGVHFRRLLKP
jgi:hypothetical protein